MSGLDGLATVNQSLAEQPEQLAMLKRAGPSDVEAIVSFETDVMNRRLYGPPLDHAAALAEVRANEYFLHIRLERTAASGAWRRRDDGTA